MTDPLTLLDDAPGGAPSPFFTWGAEGRLTSANQAAADLVGQPREAVLGCHLQSEYGALLSERRLQAAHTLRVEQRLVEYETCSAPLSRWWHIRLTPVKGGAAVHLQDVTETKRLAQLVALSQSLAAALTPDQVIGITAREVQTLSGAERGTLLGPAEAAAFECFSAWGYGAEAPETLLRSCAVRQAAHTHQLVVESAQTPHPGCLAALPLVAGGHLLAVLTLDFAGVGALDTSAAPFLLALAQQCAQALARVRSGQASEETQAHFEFLAQASVLLSASLEIRETAHQDADQLALLRTFLDRYPPSPDTTYGVIGVQRSGAADFAPYRAKREGRNRVECAPRAS